MKASTKRRLGIVLVVALVAVAGCVTGGGGDSGDSGDGDEDDTTTAMATDGGTDGGTTDEATPTTTPPTTAPPTTPPTTTPPTTTPRTTTEDGGDDGLSESRHAAALREAGSYTVTLTFDSAQSAQTFRITQKSEVESGERYAVVESGNNTFEYYQPPNSETAYRYAQGQAREIPPQQAFFFNITDIDSSSQNEFFNSARRAGTGQTDLGTATKYVIDSVEDLPDSTLDQWDEIESVRFVVFVDQDTGIIAKYTYEVSGVQDGEEKSTSVSYEITDLGSTTVERPDWVPE